MKLAHTNDSGARTFAAGSRYGRGRSGSERRRAASDTGAIAYISTVAVVTSPTMPAQLGKGRKTSIPITQQKISDTNGTPRLSTCPSAGGTYPTRDRP